MHLQGNENNLEGSLDGLGIESVRVNTLEINLASRPTSGRHRTLILHRFPALNMHM